MVSNLTMLHHLHHFWLFSSFILVPIRLINPITLIVFTISIVINIIIGSSISLVKINKIYNSTSDNNHCIMMYHIETSFPGFSFCLTCWWHTFKFSDGQHCRDHSHNIKLENLTQSLDVQYNNLQVFIHLSHPMKPVPLLPPTATWRRPPSSWPTATVADSQAEWLGQAPVLSKSAFSPAWAFSLHCCITQAGWSLVRNGAGVSGRDLPVQWMAGG
jgi:hypothetical protein